MSIFDYIIKMLKELPSDMRGTSKTSAANHLFMTKEKCDILGKDKAQLFHPLVAKLLYLCQLTRQDVQSVVDFLCTRVKRSDKDDY